MTADEHHTTWFSIGSGIEICALDSSTVVSWNTQCLRRLLVSLGRASWIKSYCSLFPVIVTVTGPPTPASVAAR